MNILSRRSSSRRKRQQRQPTPTATSIAITTHSISSSQIITLPSSSLLLAIIICITALYAPTCHSFSLPSSSSSSSPPSPPPPPFHNPSTPEEAVQNQLHYYQTYQLNQAYQCCSPSNREATGGIDEFERLLKEPPYDLILGHERADVLLEVVPGDTIILSLNEDDGEESESGMLDDHGNMVCCLVCIRPNGKARKKYPVWFWWEMSKMGQKMELEEEEDTMTRNEWMVDSIMPDFEDLDFETESLSIEDFLEEEDGDDGDDLTIYWDFDE